MCTMSSQSIQMLISMHAIHLQIVCVSMGVCMQTRRVKVSLCLCVCACVCVCVCLSVYVCVVSCAFPLCKYVGTIISIDAYLMRRNAVSEGLYQGNNPA